jgi:hypothetical protein
MSAGEAALPAAVSPGCTALLYPDGHTRQWPAWLTGLFSRPGRVPELAGGRESVGSKLVGHSYPA